MARPTKPEHKKVTERFTINLRPEDYVRLSAIADANSMSVSWLAAYAIRNFLANPRVILDDAHE